MLVVRLVHVKTSKLALCSAGLGSHSARAKIPIARAQTIVGCVAPAWKVTGYDARKPVAGCWITFKDSLVCECHAHLVSMRPLNSRLCTLSPCPSERCSAVIPTDNRHLLPRATIASSPSDCQTTLLIKINETALWASSRVATVCCSTPHSLSAAHSQGERKNNCRSAGRLFSAVMTTAEGGAPQLFDQWPMRQRQLEWRARPSVSDE